MKSVECLQQREITDMNTVLFVFFKGKKKKMIIESEK